MRETLVAINYCIRIVGYENVELQRRQNVQGKTVQMPLTNIIVLNLYCLERKKSSPYRGGVDIVRMRRRVGWKLLEKKKTNSITTEKLYIRVRVLGAILSYHYAVAILSYHYTVAILLSFRRSCRVVGGDGRWQFFTIPSKPFTPEMHSLFSTNRTTWANEKHRLPHSVLRSVTRVYITIILSPSFPNDIRTVLIGTAYI